MDKGKYKSFSNRLIESMKTRGYGASRSPNGICMKTLSSFVGASEQICRRYIRGDALPDYDKIVSIAKHLKVSPGWLLFGENNETYFTQRSNLIDDDLMRYILSKSYHLYNDDSNHVDYADFVMGLITEVREINTTRENMERIVNLALGSIWNVHEITSATSSF